MSEIKKLLDIAATIDPLSLAILFLGLVSLGVIWLASIAITNNHRSRRK